MERLVQIKNHGHILLIPLSSHAYKDANFLKCAIELKFVGTCSGTWRRFQNSVYVANANFIAIVSSIGIIFKNEMKDIGPVVTSFCKHNNFKSPRLRKYHIAYSNMSKTKTNQKPAVLQIESMRSALY